MDEVDQVVALEAMYVAASVAPDNLTHVKVDSPAEKVRNFIQF